MNYPFKIVGRFSIYNMQIFKCVILGAILLFVHCSMESWFTTAHHSSCLNVSKRVSAFLSFLHMCSRRKRLSHICMETVKKYWDIKIDMSNHIPKDIYFHGFFDKHCEYRHEQLEVHTSSILLTIISITSTFKYLYSSVAEDTIEWVWLLLNCIETRKESHGVQRVAKLW